MSDSISRPPRRFKPPQVLQQATPKAPDTNKRSLSSIIKLPLHFFRRFKIRYSTKLPAVLPNRALLLCLVVLLLLVAFLLLDNKGISDTNINSDLKVDEDDIVSQEIGQSASDSTSDDAPLKHIPHLGEDDQNSSIKEEQENDEERKSNSPPNRIESDSDQEDGAVVDEGTAADGESASSARDFSQHEIDANSVPAPEVHPEGEVVFARHHPDTTVEMGKDPWTLLSGPATKYMDHRSPKTENFESFEVWSHIIPTLNDTRRVTQFCRIFDACRTKRGTILLPKWMKVHDIQLRRCGVSHPKYVLTSQMREKLKVRAEEEENPRKYTTLDLMSVDPSRKNRHLFVADSFPVLYYLDALFASRATPLASFIRSCVTQSNLKDGTCTQSKALRPAMFVRKEAFTSTWSRNYMNLLANSKVVPKGQPLQYLDLYAAFPKKAQSPQQDDEHAVCFQSMFVMPGKYGRVSPFALTSNNPFFRANKIERHPKERKSSECSLQLTLFNQARENGSMETAELESAVDKVLGQMDGLDNIKLNITETHINDETFNKQVHLMQETDILVAPHDVELSDILFLRPESFVLEVMPFSYYAGVFKGLASQLSLYHKFHVTGPDTESFFQCLFAFNDVKEAKVMETLERLKSVWSTAINEYRNGLEETSLHLEKPPSQFNDISHLKDCARRQTLWIQTNKLATDIVKSAAHLCR